MQVNLHGSPCIPGVFLYCFGHRKKTKFSTKSLRKYTILAQKFQTIFWPLSRPVPCGEGGTPPPYTHPFGVFGSSTRLAPSTLDLAPPQLQLLDPPMYWS